MFEITLCHEYCSILSLHSDYICYNKTSVLFVGFITCNEFDYHWTTWPVIRFKWVVESLSLWYLSLGNYTYSIYRKLHIVSYTIHQKHQNMDTKYIWNDVCKKVGVSWIRAGKDLM